MSDSIPQRRCSLCNQDFDATPEFFYLRSDGRLTGRCKPCYYKKQQERKKAPHTPKPVIPDGYKQCTGCSQIHPATSEYFHSDPRKKDGLRQPCCECRSKENKQSRQENHEVHLAYDRKIRDANRERIRAADKHYRQTERGKENQRKRQGRYRANHPGIDAQISRRYYWSHLDQCQEYRTQYNATHKEFMKSLGKRWRQSHPEQVRIAAHRRRARKLQAEGFHTEQDIQRQYKAQKGHCYYCHCKLNKYHIDHIVPLTKGGTNWPDNLVLTCPTCNISKGNKLLHEWGKGGRLL